MDDFPDIIPPSLPLEETVVKAQNRAEYEGGYAQTSPRSTRGTRKWRVPWNNMPEAHYQILKTFFLSHQGDAFNWTEPVTEEVIVSRFASDSIQGNLIRPGRRKALVEIEEI